MEIFYKRGISPVRYTESLLGGGHALARTTRLG